MAHAALRQALGFGNPKREFWSCAFRVGRTEQTLQLPELRTQVETWLIV